MTEQTSVGGKSKEDLIANIRQIAKDITYVQSDCLADGSYLRKNYIATDFNRTVKALHLLLALIEAQEEQISALQRETSDLKQHLKRWKSQKLPISTSPNSALIPKAQNEQATEKRCQRSHSKIFGERS